MDLKGWVLKELGRYSLGCRGPPQSQGALDSLLVLPITMAQAYWVSDPAVEPKSTSDLEGCVWSLVGQVLSTGILKGAL